MEITNIYTIGHGTKSLDDFIEILKKYDIDTLMDVRSNPISRFNFQFNKTWLEYDLPLNNITYKFVGDKLGGLPKDESCYTNSKVDYAKIRTKHFFKDGINELISESLKNKNIVLMCSESKPQECHRSKLIGQELLGHKIHLKHISGNLIKDQITVINELTKGKGKDDLFGENDFNSRNTY